MTVQPNFQIVIGILFALLKLLRNYSAIFTYAYKKASKFVWHLKEIFFFIVIFDKIKSSAQFMQM